MLRALMGLIFVVLAIFGAVAGTFAAFAGTLVLMEWFDQQGLASFKVPCAVLLLAMEVVLVVLCSRLGERAVRAYLSRSPHPAGHCRTCGYNLTGNISGICPECGVRVVLTPA